MSGSSNSSNNPEFAFVMTKMVNKSSFKAAITLQPHLYQKRKQALLRLDLRHIRGVVDQQNCQLAGEQCEGMPEEVEQSKRWEKKQCLVMEWLATSYCYAYHYDMSSQKERVSQFLCKVFPHKAKVLIDYTLETMLQTSRRTKKSWKEEEIRLLAKIASSENENSDWSRVSFKLFEDSRGQFFKPPATCRQKWQNYLNPTLKKGSWSNEEDMKLLKCVEEVGKKWSVVASAMGGTRNEHMVKNRFNSLIKPVKRAHSSQSDSALISLLLQKGVSKAKTTNSLTPSQGSSQSVNDYASMIQDIGDEQVGAYLEMPEEQMSLSGPKYETMEMVEEGKAQEKNPCLFGELGMEWDFDFFL